MRIVHTFVSPKVEQTDNTLVGPNEWNAQHNILDNVFRFNQDYNFTAQCPNIPLVIGSNTITLSPVPLGVNGSDFAHYLVVTDPSGSWEAVPITGGSARGGATSGTVIVTCVNAHSVGWCIKSATAGIQEAYQYIQDIGSNGPIFINDMQNDVYAQIYIFTSHIVIRGFAWGSLIRAVDNAHIKGGIIKTNSNAFGFGLYSLTLDGNAQNWGTDGNTAVDGCLFIGSSNTRIESCYIRYGSRVGIFMGDGTTVVSDVVISDCLISTNGGWHGSGAGGVQNSGYFGNGIYMGGAAIPDNIKIIYNTIVENHNQVTQPGDGCGINGSATHVLVMGNYFQNNYNVGGGQIGMQVFAPGGPAQAVAKAYWNIIGNEICCTGTMGSPTDNTCGIEIAGSNFNVIGNNIHNVQQFGIFVDGNGSGYGSIIGNTIDTCQDGIGIHPIDGSYVISHVTISGNTVLNASNWGVVLYAIHNYITVRGNDLGGLNQSVAGMTGTFNEITDNVYTTSPAPVNIPVTASPMTYTASAFKEQISIMGAASLTVTLASGITVASGTPTTWNYVINSNEQITITYTGTPTIHVNYLH